VVAGVIAVILIAVPLYLLRRPSLQAPIAAADAGTDAQSAEAAAAPTPSALVPKPPERIKLAPATRVQCGARPTGGNEGSLCDGLPAFEQALATAIQASLECAPKAESEGSINYVLNIDFASKRIHVFPGASGGWHGKQARRATQCVERALVRPDFASLTHQYRYYSIAILATYRPPGASRDPTAVPVFE
jgi:hypothetical protein